MFTFISSPSLSLYYTNCSTKNFELWDNIQVFLTIQPKTMNDRLEETGSYIQ
ncbi:hypothetical protein QY97_03822 [Bacillus thermotolerans]|nr:hypothetical protein QY97_03822 [Bacillus thermotolerans]